jgi:HAD superfamily hydrolase (TIGR01509 family)
MAFVPAGIIFDMDGVLCASEHYIAQAACQMFAELHRIQVKPHDFAPFVGMGEDRFLGGVAEKYRVRLSLPRDKDRTYEIYLQLIRGKLQPLPGTVAFIRAGRHQRLKLAVATSADRVKLDGNLKEIGIPGDSFDALVTGNEVIRKKPYPDIFQLAAQRIGVPATQCLVVEDAPSGVQAAKAAGCQCWALTTSFQPSMLQAAGADWVTPSLANVPREIGVTG